MEQIVLGGEEILETELEETTLEQLLEEGGSEAVTETAVWDDTTRYDQGWQRAGGESFYRVAYTSDGSPQLVQKSGNPRKTLERGSKLDEAGGVVIPTVMLVDPDARDGTGTINGASYTIFQAHVPSTFTERYKDDSVTETAIRDLGKNAAALDTSGFRPTQPGRQLSEMLSDGEHTYLVDFGGDIGAGRHGATDRMYQACLEELDDEDTAPFQDGYETVRGKLPESEPDDPGY